MDLPHTPYTLEKLHEEVENSLLSLRADFYASHFPAVHLHLHWELFQEFVYVKITWWRITPSGDDYQLKKTRMRIKDDLGLIAFKSAVVFEKQWMEQFCIE